MGALDPFIGVLYAGLENTNREMTGFLRSAARNAEATQAAKGQMVYAPIADAAKPVEIVPGAHAPNVENPDVEKVGITIEHEVAIQVKLDGNETLGLSSSGNYNRVLQSRIENAYRQLANMAEKDVAAKAVAGASRAYGDGTKSMFATKDSLEEFAQMAKILDENGCPEDGRNIVLSNSAMASLRSFSFMNKANELGSDEFVRYGYTEPIVGFKLWKSAGLSVHKAGEGSGYKTAGSFKAGVKDLSVEAGTGTLLTGDVVTIDGESYVIGKGIDAPGIISLNRPGLMKDVATGVALTAIGNYAPCVAFHEDAIQVALRAPALPVGGDSAVDSTIVFDPASGLVFRVSMYKQYHQTILEIGLAYGSSVMRSENVAVLADKAV